MLTRTGQQLKCFEQNGLTCTKHVPIIGCSTLLNVVEMYDMVIRRGAVVVCAVTVALSGTLVAQNRNQNQKEQQKQAPKLTNAQKADLATIIS